MEEYKSMICQIQWIDKMACLENFRVFDIRIQEFNETCGCVASHEILDLIIWSEDFEKVQNSQEGLSCWTKWELCSIPRKLYVRTYNLSGSYLRTHIWCHIWVGAYSHMWRHMVNNKVQENEVR